MRTVRFENGSEAAPLPSAARISSSCGSEPPSDSVSNKNRLSRGGSFGSKSGTAWLRTPTAAGASARSAGQGTLVSQQAHCLAELGRWWSEQGFYAEAEASYRRATELFQGAGDADLGLSIRLSLAIVLALSLLLPQEGRSLLKFYRGPWHFQRLRCRRIRSER